MLYGTLLDENLDAFLKMITWSEMGPTIMDNSDNGFNVLVGSTPDMILTFSSYHRHPSIPIRINNNGLVSSAAGAFQIVSRIWKAYWKQLGLKGFYPEDQQKIAIQLIKECRAVEDIDKGDITTAIFKCRSRWASFPGANYNQHEQKLLDLLDVYAKYKSM